MRWVIEYCIVKLVLHEQPYLSGSILPSYLSKDSRLVIQTQNIFAIYSTRLDQESFVCDTISADQLNILQISSTLCSWCRQYHKK